MQLHATPERQALAGDPGPPSLGQLVMGVHWSPAPRQSNAADLDAMCVLYDKAHRVLDVIHGNRQRNENESVIHTGDSRDGANHWDDERIFVFPEALPDAVVRLCFVVVCADGRPFHEIPGACCHLTDHASEHEWLRLDLTTLRGRQSHTVATLQRCNGSWSLMVPPDGSDAIAAQG